MSIDEKSANWERIGIILSLAILMTNLPTVYKICLKDIDGAEGWILYTIVIGTILILFLALLSDIYKQKNVHQSDKIRKVNSLFLLVVAYTIALIVVIGLLVVTSVPLTLIISITILACCIFAITCVLWWFLSNIF
ncbi:hypothetical protein [Methanorbis furvi]|uniref:hypothetical protein n=1 Tax=Methanorbis furvi TaxID=3028299 RepID=UPI0030B8BEEE